MTGNRPDSSSKKAVEQVEGADGGYADDEEQASFYAQVGEVVIEDTAELRIEKPNVLAAECQTESINAKSNSMHCAGVRIGEVRGEEARTFSIPSTPATVVRWPQRMGGEVVSIRSEC